MRLHELAKEIGAESKALLALAKDLGLGVRNHSSSLAPGQVAILKAAYRESVGEGAGEAAAEEAAPKRKKRVRRKKKVEPAEVQETEADESDVDADSPELDAEEPAPAAVDASDAVEAPLSEVTAEEAASAEPEEFPEPQEEPAEAVPEVEEAPAASAPSSPEPTPAAADEPASTPAPTPSPVEAPESTEPEPGRPAARQKPAASPSAGGTATSPENKPEVRKVTPRKRSGAKIVGRIELPKEEIEKARGPRTSPGGGGGYAPDPTGPFFDDPTGRGRGGVAREQDPKKKTTSRVKDDPLSWSPDDEDDPLLQGIRIRNVQTGPHQRRPPRRVGPRRSGRRAPAPTPTGPVDVQVPITIRDLSQILGSKANDIIRILMRQGIMAGVNQALDEDGVLEVATALNREVNITTEKGKEESFLAEVDEFEKQMREQSDTEQRASRAPVVAFLGHVDHGKTSLLDYIRKDNVAAGEAGGITQSMRAYSVLTESGQRITCLDTPGHKAFTEMRARGAHVTDIVVLVVAADDGVMPQTAEAIQHALAAETPIVVALNKVDKPEANVDRVLQQLASEGVMVEGWGGEVQYQPVSAITGQGIPDLLEKLALQAEIMDLKADPTRPAVGTVIESKKDEKLGAVATVLVQEGTLRAGDVVLSGTAYGRIRTLIDDQGRKVDEVGPSTPVNLIGLNETPDASERIWVVEDLRKAREVAEEREQKKREERVGGATAAGGITLDNLFANLEAGKTEEVVVVLRCDVQGSLEVLRRELADLSTKEVKVKVIREALGGITEDDVLLALASKGIVIGFNVIADEKARGQADQKGVEIRSYQIIYELIDDMKAAMEGMLSPIQKEEVVGHVEIREVFKVSRLGSIAGCRVQDGVIRRNSRIRVTRDGRILHTGTLDSLKRFKDDVREVKEGMECGLHVDGYDDIKVGDVLEVIEMREEKRTLDFANS
ncbi:MAG: translation initiation factor IF-2 [Planctomycetota bacterium JB042]